MILYLQEKLRQLNMSYNQFFAVAFWWQFKRTSMLNDDEAQYLLHGVIPRYVVNYLKHIQQKESRNENVDVSLATGDDLCGIGPSG